MPPTPSAEVIERIQAGFTRIYTRVDIYEADTTTPWMLDAATIDGSVSVDANRDERRTLSITFANDKGDFKSHPGGFWYDKVIKVFRGIEGHVNYILDGDGNPILDDDGDPIIDETTSLDRWETQLGEFYIDDLDVAHFPRTVNVTARDATKKLLEAKFATSTTYASGVSIESVVRAVAVAGGVPIGKISLPATGVNTTRDHTYDRTSERWKAIAEIGTDYGYSIYFDYEGVLSMEPFADPADVGASPSLFTFEAGGRDVRNGKFRDINPDTGLPDWWTQFQITGTPVANMEDGSQSLNDQSLEISTSTTGQLYRIASKAIHVAPGDQYEVSVWSKATSATAGKHIHVAFAATEDSMSTANIIDLQNGTNFTTEYSEDVQEFTVPTGMGWMRIVLGSGTGAVKTAWFDQVTCRRTFPVEDTKGNIVSYGKKAISSRIYNHVVVSGENNDADTIPVWQEVENNNADSPTRIAALGRRTYFYSSPFITTEAQALDVATRFLAVMALESFEVALDSIVHQWLEPNNIVSWVDPEATSVDPTRYLLSDLTIPLKPAPMQANAKRVTIVG